MPLHRLTDIKISGHDRVLAELPDFDFHRIKDVRRVEIVAPSEAAPLTLQIEAVYRTQGSSTVVRLQFTGVQELVLPAFGPGFAFKELEVEDVRGHGHEGVSFEVIDHYERDFRCRCSHLEVSVAK